MLPVFVFRFLVFSQLGQLLLAGKGNGNQGKCPSSFNCSSLGMIEFPFTTRERPNCGILDIAGCDGPEPNSLKTVKLNGKFPYVVLHVGRSSLIVQDLVLHNLLRSKNCDVFSSNFTFPSNSPLASYISLNVTLYRCNRTLNVSPPSNHFLKYSCPDNIDIYYDPHPSSSEKTDGSLSACSMVQLPSKDFPDNSDPFTFVSSEIFLQVELSDDCDKCYHQKGGHCQLDNDKKFHCTCTEERRSLALKLGLGLGLPAIVIGLLVGLVYKRKYASSNVQFHSRDTYSDPYSDESSSAYYGIPVFSYKELEEATNNFDRTRELGDGGFGTVYYGKLQDGREVAVKHLYEHNYRRVQQFMNEVKILTHLRHKNLVSLYGCTSRQSRELLLVYEYIPNGTVACHLHGDLAKPGLMPWHVRMKIAIETASALVYLHASDIIHRDVKTSNILLDNSFCVKVADFGLSRMFPSDVTHVSTAPQGTPGYVDPEYYRCYQLTSKSDVYSFGVVLIELISSMPAVDMSRHNDEINLADLAVKKIQKSAFSELVDPSLGFESDNDVKRMLVLVAELAFQCLQREKELRPSMDEVLEALKSIESGEDEPDHQDEADVQDAGTLHSNIHPVPPSSPEEDEVGLLNKLKPPRSPNSVTDNWESKSTTPNVSG